MYIYFDVNGNLREIIYNPVRKGSYNDDQIFIYVEPQSGGLIEEGVYKLPTAYPSGKISFANLDTGNSLNGNDGTPLPLTKLSGDNAIQIPYDSKRDLKYFKYGYKYEVWFITLPSTVTESDGVVVTTPYLYNETAQKALNTFTFNVEASIGIALGSTMSESQYSYLYNKIQEYLDLRVPYTGAVNDVVLGNHTIAANGFVAPVTNGAISFNGGGFNYIVAGAGLIETLQFPYPTGSDKTIASEEWTKNVCLYSNDDDIYVVSTDSSRSIAWYSEGYYVFKIGEKRITVNDYGENETRVSFPTVTPAEGEDYTDVHVAYQEWVKSRHNGIYEVSSDFFPSSTSYVTISLDIDTLKDIVENANALVKVVTGDNSVRTFRRRIIYCEVGYNSTRTTLTDAKIVYEEDEPNSSSGYDYIETKLAWKLYYNGTTVQVKKICDVDNS